MLQTSAEQNSHDDGESRVDDCSLALARKQQAKSWELSAAMSMARL